jgi:hypothetical protein
MSLIKEKIDNELAAKYQTAILEEFKSAAKQYGPFHTDHEGWAVLKEEVDELWDAVKLKQRDPDRKRMMERGAIQVGAMALRFLHDMRRRDY